MGKKHKKHKAEKPEDVRSAEYVEKPLKLVLKVGSGEVKEISTARATALPQSFHEDKSDHDKHKDKKKKKKKKEEKKVGPGEEKKKKKDEKKKKDRNQHESEAEKERKIQSPMRVDMPAVPVPESSLAKPEENQTPLQEALNQLVRQLQRKDPSAFFSFPVTDFIAPGYSMVIKNPMDFSTVKEKIKTNEYQSIEELKEDFTQICDNAMVYNKPGTVYYKAATKLLNSGIKILSQERIQSLKQSIDFMVDLQTDGKERGPGEAQGADGQVKEESMDTDDVTAFKSPIKELKRRERDLQEDRQRLNESAAEKEKEQIDLIIKGSLGKLSKRGISSQLEFERRKPDGTTTLGLLNPPADAHPGEMGYSHTHLGLAASRLQAGVNSLHGFKEDKRNKVTPVLYLNYGPFSSYAPAYDSTFANISKDDSDLIYTTYGDEPSAQGAFSIQEFLESTQDPPYGMADCILDAVTNGEYSRSQRVLDMPAESGCTSKLDYNSTADQLACLKSVFGLGIFEETFDSAEAGAFQRKLDETTSLLRELQDVQSKRLSTKPPPNAVCLLAPSAQELQLSEKVNGNLKELAQQVNPGDIVSVQGVRKAMGISAPPPGSGQALVDLTADTQEKGAIPGSGECVVVGT